MNDGCFKPGNVPHNKGKKLIDYASVKSIWKIQGTQFKKGETAGDKSNNWKGGIQTIKNDVVHLYTGINKRVRRPKKVYEDAHGKMPKNWVIYHLDGVMHNDHIDNLIAIPRAILMKINANRINVNYHELKTEVENYLKTKS